MKTLKERIKEHSIEYKRKVHCEKIAQKYIDVLVPLFPKKTEVLPSCGINHFSLTFTHVETDTFELEIISEISKACICKWTKCVHADGVSYQTSFIIGDGTCYCGYLSIYTILPNTCQIVAIPTGKKKVSKWIEVEEEQFEHKVLCSEED